MRLREARSSLSMRARFHSAEGGDEEKSKFPLPVIDSNVTGEKRHSFSGIERFGRSVVFILPRVRRIKLHQHNPRNYPKYLYSGYIYVCVVYLLYGKQRNIDSFVSENPHSYYRRTDVRASRKGGPVSGR